MTNLTCEHTVCERNILEYLGGKCLLVSTISNLQCLISRKFYGEKHGNCRFSATEIGNRVIDITSEFCNAPKLILLKSLLKGSWECLVDHTGLEADIDIFACRLINDGLDSFIVEGDRTVVKLELEIELTGNHKNVLKFLNRNCYIVNALVLGKINHSNCAIRNLTVSGA